MKEITNLIDFIKGSQPSPDAPKITCPNCQKELVDGTPCQCTKVPSWAHDITKEIPLNERNY